MVSQINPVNPNPTPRPPRATPTAMQRPTGVDLFTGEQMFEEDVRAVLNMMRPHRRERLLGWDEYRTGGAHFRATISWDSQFEATATGDPAAEDRNAKLAVPNLVDVLESILIGSMRSELELETHEEFDLYRQVVRELYKRVNETQACYE